MERKNDAILFDQEREDLLLYINNKCIELNRGNFKKVIGRNLHK
jgi:hypothetical protein